MDKKKILIFPAGTEIAFEIFNALKYSKFVEIYGGTSVSDHSEYVYKNLIKGIPFVDSPDFIEKLNEVIHKYGIQYIYPAHDIAHTFMSENEDDIDAVLVSANKETVRICRSKEETYRHFAEEDFIPAYYEAIEDVKEYPVFVKPKVGQGASGALKANSKEQLEFALRENPELIICEYLEGIEYSIDCFTDRFGELKVIKLRDRERIRTGISVRSKELPVDEDIRRIAAIINNGLKFRGAWFFQVKKNSEGKYKLMEISPRIPGTMGLSRNMGMNFPMLTLFDIWDCDTNIIDNGYDISVDRAFYSAYKIDVEYEFVYVDFDDTLIIDDKVNEDLVKFLYQAINKNKKIILLSKHRNDINESLKKYRISKDLFDEIIILKMEEKKSDCICKYPAIFIDDAFAERNDVSRNKGIPVFDVDMVEALIDWRK